VTASVEGTTRQSFTDAVKSRNFGKVTPILAKITKTCCDRSQLDNLRHLAGVRSGFACLTVIEKYK
jgi:hypothetical protein